MSFRVRQRQIREPRACRVPLHPVWYARGSVTSPSVACRCGCFLVLDFEQLHVALDFHTGAYAAINDCEEDGPARRFGFAELLSSIRRRRGLAVGRELPTGPP